MTQDPGELIRTALALREQNGGRHLHHRHCIHNLPPEDQVTTRGRSVEWWLQMFGSLPEQITPEQWEIESPFDNGSLP